LLNYILLYVQEGPAEESNKGDSQSSSFWEVFPPLTIPRAISTTRVARPGDHRERPLRPQPGVAIARTMYPVNAGCIQQPSPIRVQPVTGMRGFRNDSAAIKRWQGLFDHEGGCK